MKKTRIFVMTMLFMLLSVLNVNNTEAGTEFVKTKSNTTVSSPDNKTTPTTTYGSGKKNDAVEDEADTSEVSNTDTVKVIGMLTLLAVWHLAIRQSLQRNITLRDNFERKR